MNFCMVSVNEPLQKPQVEIFNGSVRVVFSSRQEAENFMTIENVTYNDSTIIRMWQYVAHQLKSSTIILLMMTYQKSTGQNGRLKNQNVSAPSVIIRR